ncbi:DUF881 domain-containing protein [Nocardioides panaciterrulae]|uniref:Uncharacterized protein YlxW (UPF0749 family) n=1 Tax=Nocardioides panaciterrulae TaxID=661492 RepID=A0A7Y9E6L5_9ACTN|nr:DUF881 domain-containing protein [Nocardioides panaciterrulae]NYD41952.1 uncharacterized protein YlxW (UPF0749 family) [Nocardioides panaciterrulae]
MADHLADGRSPLPARVTMPLLTLITQQSLDEDYLHAAERRAAGAPLPSRGRPRRTAAVVIAAFGLLVTVAAVQTSRDAGVTDASRASLVSQIDSRREAVSRLQDRIVQLRDDNVGLQQRLDQVSSTAQEASGRVRRLGARSGYLPVTGPGVRITIEDPPNADATTLVRDEDLAKLVDGLWTAGAEAIAINGHRLTVLSAIRNVGVAIHVNSQPLTPPYTVLAIGDTKSLQAKLLSSALGGEFFGLARQLGFGYSMRSVDKIDLPAARGPGLRYVTTGGTNDQKPPGPQEGNQ